MLGFWSLEPEVAAAAAAAVEPAAAKRAAEFAAFVPTTSPAVAARAADRAVTVEQLQNESNTVARFRTCSEPLLVYGQTLFAGSTGWYCCCCLGPIAARE